MSVTMPAAAEQIVKIYPTPPHQQTAPTLQPGRWSVDAIEDLFNLPFPELMHRAQTVHRENFDPTRVEFATLLSVKTGGCPEDCNYCPQAARFDTDRKSVV